MKVIYIAGPYRSDCEWQLEQFIRHAEDAAIRLWKDGWAAYCSHKNTAHFGGALGILDKTWLDGNIEILTRCDAIYMLKNWAESQGAQAELELAQSLDLQVIYE